MKISMVSEHSSPIAPPGGVDSGGQNVHVAALSRSLAARGHHVTVFTRRDSPGTPTRVAMCDGVEVVHLTAGPERHVPKEELLPHMCAFAAGLAAAWSVEPPDIVHGHFWMSGLAALDGRQEMLGPSPKPPIVQTFHALGSVKRRCLGAADESPPERARLEPMVGRQVDAVIATCPDEVQELTLLGVPTQRIAVAPCGVDTQLFTPSGPVEARGARFRILSVGRLVPRKGFDLAINALALLREFGFDDFELVIAGSGSTSDGSDPERSRLAAIAKQLNVASLVHFRGAVPRDDMPALFRSSDVVVCSPLYEPFGIVPLESMACASPVVATRVGGLQNSIVDGETGLLVPPRKPTELACAIARLLTDERLRRALGDAGRQRAEREYDWAQVAKRTEHIYEQVIAGEELSSPRLTEVAK